MEWSVLLLVLIVIFVFLLKFKIEKSTAFPYEQQPHLFSPAEKSFYGVLNQVVDNDTVIFGKVRIADVIRPRKGLNRQAWGRAFHRISSKHFDFLLCDSKDLSVKAVIELDDNSHSQKKRQNRDEFVENACAAAGLKIHRFNVSSGYKIDQIRNELYPQTPITPDATEFDQIRISPSPIDNAEEKENSTTDSQISQMTVCPKCSSDLVIKIAKQGKYKGEQFLACTAFPKCRFIQKIKG